MHLIEGKAHPSATLCTCPSRSLSRGCAGKGADSLSVHGDYAVKSCCCTQLHGGRDGPVTRRTANPWPGGDGLNHAA